MNTIFFPQTFRGSAGISQQNPRISRQKKFDLSGFEGHTELFGPHPFMWKTPPPTENIHYPVLFLVRLAPLGRIVRSVFVRSKWAGLGAQKGTPSAPQPMSCACQRFPLNDISYEFPSREKVLKRPSIVLCFPFGATGPKIKNN